MRKPGSGDLRLLLRVLKRTRAFWPHITGILLLGLLSSPLALLAPLPMKIAVDSVLGNHPLPGFLQGLVAVGASGAVLLALAVGLLLAVALVGQLRELSSSMLRAYTGERIVLDLRSALFGHVQRLSFAYSDSRGTADSAYRIQSDASAIQSVAIDGFIPFVTETATVGAMVYVMARIDWVLAAVALAIAPCLMIALGAVRKRLRRRSREVKRLESGALSVVQEVLSAIRVVKAFGQEDREQRRFVDRSREGMRARLGMILDGRGFGILVAMITAAGTAAVLYLGVRHVQAGRITLGDLWMVLGYLAQLYSPLKTMSGKVARLQSNLASAERAFALLEEPPDVLDRPGARRLPRAAGAVEFRGVGFGYGIDRTVLKDVCLEIPAGTRVGVVGATGAGKTTLVSLLSRFYDPTAGRILLDGVDLRDWKLADLRHQFAIVLQEPVLFSTSIAENIAYGRPEASRAQIVAAAEAAGAAEFIRRLREGYESSVGERGMRLSGGERQRISLARAFLKDAPILILDEPTSSVDVGTEAAILGALEGLMHGRTTFLISHRASTLELCDMVVRIEDGRVVSVSHRGNATFSHAG
ncbi:MAG TPA: ABC transporter ATP-binding protein [Planctomycetota bacterium]|jgi:ATP-binding cassette subfamily B protein|nr:ABC transporter ATP-binding protein [Planctomycetota bacterium]